MRRLTSNVGVSFIMFYLLLGVIFPMCGDKETKLSCFGLFN